MWDTSPITKPEFATALRRWLPTQGLRFKTLVQYYYATDKDKVFTMSDNQTDLLLNGMIATGSFKDPVLIHAADVTLHANAHPGAGATHANYQTRPDRVIALDNELWALIATCINDVDTADELAEQFQHSGCTALIQFTKDVRETAKNDDGSYGEAVLEKIAEIEAGGIAECKVTAFNAFKSALNAQRQLLPDGIAMSDVTFARKLLTAALKVSPFVRQTLDNYVQLTDARGDLDKTKMAVIHVYSQHELDNRSTPGSAGRGMHARSAAAADDWDAIEDKKSLRANGKLYAQEKATPGGQARKAKAKARGKARKARRAARALKTRALATPIAPGTSPTGSATTVPS